MKLTFFFSQYTVAQLLAPLEIMNISQKYIPTQVYIFYHTRVTRNMWSRGGQINPEVSILISAHINISIHKCF